jgi:indolepyruvate ferredoxin oxidoreductase alpha subunit
MCLKVGCPAISQKKQENGKTKAFIDPNQCLGCGVCVETCRLDAIKTNEGGRI